MSAQGIRIDRAIFAGLVAIAAVAAAVAAFHGALAELGKRWIAQEEYSHGFFIREADLRLQSFIRRVEPKLSQYLLPDTILEHKSALFRPFERRS